MVALTGIERANGQFSSVQSGLNACKHLRLVRRWRRKVRYEFPTWHPHAGIRLRLHPGFWLVVRAVHDLPRTDDSHLPHGG